MSWPGSVISSAAWMQHWCCWYCISQDSLNKVVSILLGKSPRIAMIYPNLYLFKCTTNLSWGTHHRFAKIAAMYWVFYIHFKWCYLFWWYFDWWMFSWYLVDNLVVPGFDSVWLPIMPWWRVPSKLRDSWIGPDKAGFMAKACQPFLGNPVWGNDAG